MDKVLADRLEELRSYSKDEDWYITKQELNFMLIATFGIQSLEKYKKYQSDHPNSMSFGKFYDEYLKKRPDSRFIRGAYYYGLMNSGRAVNAVPTDASNEFMNRLSSVEAVMDRQLEKVRIPLPGEKSDLRNKFNVFIAPTLYSILLELSTGLTKEELSIFVITIKKYNDYKNAVECIKSFRKLSDTEQNSIKDEFKDKFNVRINRVFSQLSVIYESSGNYYLKKDDIDEVKEKVQTFSEHLSYYENLDENKYETMLQSNVDLWNAWNVDIDSNESNKLEESVKDGINEIYVGAPGTGKSFYLDKSVEKIYPKNNDEYNEFVFRTTFYPDYSYYDFIGDIKPVKRGNDITYDFAPGIFTRALLKAIKNPSKRVFLIIEEMSRGNSEAIFGDVFQLLDRDDDGKSTYTIDNNIISDYFDKNGVHNYSRIYIPANMSIFATINSSDQNVYVLDTAFKRRFQFKFFSTRPVNDENNFVFEINGNKFHWIDFYQELNKFIINDLGLEEDKQIGQWFIKGSNDEKKNSELIRNKLLNYLWEDVDKVALASGDNSSIFNSKYKTFTDIYYDFYEPNKNIFNDVIMDASDSEGNI